MNKSVPTNLVIYMKRTNYEKDTIYQNLHLRNTDYTKCWQGCGLRNSHSLWVRILNGTATLEDSSVVSDRTAIRTLNTTSPMFFPYHAPLFYVTYLWYFQKNNNVVSSHLIWNQGGIFLFDSKCQLITTFLS